MSVLFYLFVLEIVSIHTWWEGAKTHLEREFVSKKT